jgi:hypothetical protein
MMSDMTKGEVLRFSRRWFRRGVIIISLTLVLLFAASMFEMATRQRLLPYSPYRNCGMTTPESLPDTIRIGLYEEFPVPWRLDKLQHVDFPVSLAIATTLRTEFLELRQTVMQQYPVVREVYFWPLLPPAEGYYPGAWSNAAGVKQLAQDAENLPTLWDLEMPPNLQGFALNNWWQNRTFLDDWLHTRKHPVHIWRSHTSMGLNPLFLRLMAMHYDPQKYPMVSLHLDLYMTGAGLSSDDVARILRCGVEQYGERFIPSFGVLDDGEGSKEIFIPPDTLRRNLQLAHETGVSEIWLFGVNGLNTEYLDALRETIPIESLATAQ